MPTINYLTEKYDPEAHRKAYEPITEGTHQAIITDVIRNPRDGMFMYVMTALDGPCEGTAMYVPACTFLIDVEYMNLVSGQIVPRVTNLTIDVGGPMATEIDLPT